MTSKWSSKALNNAPAGELAASPEEFVVILIQGKNTFGDRIYSYLKTTVENLKRMYSDMQGGKTFNPFDYGSVVAAGKGDPPDEVRAEVAALYKLVDGKSAAGGPASPAPTQKAWDEY